MKSIIILIFHQILLGLLNQEACYARGMYHTGGWEGVEGHQLEDLGVDGRKNDLLNGSKRSRVGWSGLD